MKHAVITTASLQADNLYHVDDITKFLTYKKKEHSNINTTKEVNRDDLKGSAHIQYKNTIKDMDPLEVLHVRLGHASESVIKKICKRNILTGLQNKVNQINCTWRNKDIYRYRYNKRSTKAINNINTNTTHQKVCR
jgi:hypothetical protein